MQDPIPDGDCTTLLSGVYNPAFLISLSRVFSLFFIQVTMSILEDTLLIVFFISSLRHFFPRPSLMLIYFILLLALQALHFVH